MVTSGVARCPRHPEENLVRTPACYSYECPVCRIKVCSICSGTKGMTWASSTCRICGSQIEQEQYERKCQLNRWDMDYKFRLEDVVVKARSLRNNLPDGEIEMARESLGNTNTRIIQDAARELSDALKALDDHIGQKPK